jgi:hypothetical protein
LGCRDQKDDGLRPAQTKKVDLISISQAWWCILVISVIQEAQVGGSWTKARSGWVGGESQDPIRKITRVKKDWERACMLAQQVWSRVQTPISTYHPQKGPPHIFIPFTDPDCVQNAVLPQVFESFYWLQLYKIYLLNSPLLIRCAVTT